MTKHTPGPWKADKTWGLITALGGMVEVAACHAGRGSLQETDANARLIAAAPELLGIVKRIAEVSEAFDTNTDKGLRALVLSMLDLGNDAKQAIAKAEGRE